MEGRKRKLPSRGTRAEPASKKRAASASTSNTPEQRQTPTPVVAAPSPVVEEKETLPKSIAPGQPLPTVDEPQPNNLSSKDFQSVSESGVLLDSLQRSRQKWITEGIFEKYWTKTLKKKGWEEPPNNPSRDTMTKLGPCTIVVEPHAFEAIMYTVKDPNQPAFIKDTPMARPPVIQYGPPNGMMPPPAPTPPPQQSQFHIPPPSVKPSTSGAETFKTTMSPASTPNSFQPSPHPNVQSRPPQNGQATPRQPQNPPNAEAGPDMTEAKKDPVIQMLAERASSNPELKALMKIVAQGNASPEELQKFQSHINDLTRLQKARQAAAIPHPSTMQSPAPSGPATPQGNQISRPSPASTVRAMPTPPPPKPVPQPQALRSKGPVPPAKGDATGIVFEFVGGNGDRYLFPKFSILEPRAPDPYTRESLVIVSFLIARKGSSSDSPTYDPNLDYYQPITIRLYAAAKYIETLQRVVAPPEEVRRYMEDVMENMTRAEYVLLAMRLPRDKGEPASTTQDKEKTEVVQAEKAVNTEEQVLWATTNSTPPVTKVISKTKSPVATQQDKYQCFINTIASTS
ncbi:hypothetical protein HYFRA_00008126 [Hymenoscyphus fraxineus]|uniref:SWR1-complex protein 3 domain-containing protein n=1 Tax=Hymenoscyphus fraxineus TaxID=746836 RepID=A0A9N9L9B4_9HELO|nr:hypothetical protein HYFRA_00008126 [Hymenoscyphus fraxineus]